jgi:ribonuclease VapC
MAAAVLDAHALLAFFRGEDAGLPVKELLHKAATADRPLHMTEVNYAEVKYMLLRKDGAKAWEQAEDVLKSVPLEFHPVTRELADVAADFKARFKISLADAFAAALAKEKKAELVTGDPEFKPLEKEIKIVWLKLFSRLRSHLNLADRP